jgi:hypothetical protein
MSYIHTYLGCGSRESGRAPHMQHPNVMSAPYIHSLILCVVRAYLHVCAYTTATQPHSNTPTPTPTLSGERTSKGDEANGSSVRVVGDSHP